LYQEQTEQYDECCGDDERFHRRLDDSQALHRAEYGDGRSDDAVAVQERGPENAEDDEESPSPDIRAPVLPLEYEGQRGKHATFAAIVSAQDEHKVFDDNDEHQRPENQRQNALDVGDGRRQAVVGVKCLPDSVERAGPDVAIDDAEGGKRQHRQSFAARVCLDVLVLRRWLVLDCGRPPADCSHEVWSVREEPRLDTDASRLHKELAARRQEITKTP
jgi:hypothetical protein